MASELSSLYENQQFLIQESMDPFLYPAIIAIGLETGDLGNLE
tara:strand:- start:283 stop:411 length:129 start_codon:yes stop_codon:yes gene_type:complete